MAALIDTHAHLIDEQFAGDRAAVLARAAAAGVESIISVSTSSADSRSNLQFTCGQSSVFATVGIHPNHAAQEAADGWDAVVALATDAKVVGIGETGLDRHWHDTPFPVQEDYFARHLDLSRRLGKPVIIHCREAEADMLAMLRAAYQKHGPIRGVMHSFTGDQAMAGECLAMGLFLSFAGMLTYRNAELLRETAGRQPLDRLLVETDCPYLSPVPLRGKRNEPAHVVHTAACLARLHGIAPEELARQTTANARQLFGLKGN